MKNRDTKSLLIGFALGVTAILALGQNSSSSSQVGRYQVAGAGGDGTQVFVIIDTTTGSAKVLSGMGVPMQTGVNFEQLKARRP